MAMKIKKGDPVIVIAGKEKGREGKVLHVNTKDNTVIVIISVNHHFIICSPYYLKFFFKNPIPKLQDNGQNHKCHLK